MSTNDPQKSQKSAVALQEEAVLAFWNDNKIFQKSVDKDAPKGDFVFYDGPPYGTGEPHYGHLLPGTIKDVIPRYKTMQGYRVARRWGWDCHGLPIENLIEKELNLNTKKEIEAYGIDKFNQAARDSVLRYEASWKEIIPRTGRWVDMSNPYKTMDPSYMESVWWVFKSLTDKGLVSEGFKAMHICPRCETPLSNFEVNQGYEDVKDLSVTAKFELVDEPGTYMLAWTTTPWTLPGNVALAVGSDITYVKVTTEGSTCIIAKERLEDVFKDMEVTVLEELSGNVLVGKKYKPLFDYYAADESLENRDNGWQIYAADFVTTDDGTGVVHIAPAFGSDDYSLLEQYDLPFVQHVTIGGEFKPEVTDFAGMKVKAKGKHMDTDIEIVKWLAHENKLFSKLKIEHSYPHCWRCDTPLLNYATSSWFIDVPSLQGKLLEGNSKTRWVPEHVRDGRFGKWLEGSRPWAVSRARYWGTPLPVWKSATGDVLTIGSVADLRAHIKSSGNQYYFIRHGESDSNVKGYLNSDLSVENPLTDRGREQVKAAVADITAAGGCDLVYVSPLQRTQETAAILAEALGLADNQVITDERIREFEMGEFEGQPYTDFAAKRDTELHFGAAVAEGDSYRTLTMRVGEFMYDIESQHQGKKILIVAHGGVAEALHALEYGYDDVQAWQHFHDFFTDNAELKQFEFLPLPHNERYELDLHRPYIDSVVLEKDGQEYHRIQDVFDVWFDSGSMPYGQAHYPFEDVDNFEGQRFPANFIAEGQDQTRGWFYTLSVLGTALFGRLPFENVVVNGMVLAEDGKKMSKRLKNYPEITYVMDKYGMDVLRLVFMASPAVHAEDLRFSEKLLQEALSKVSGRLRNVVNLYELYKTDTTVDPLQSPSVLDQWIIALLSGVGAQITLHLDNYELDKAAKLYYDFVDDLSTWYARRSRDRFKADGGDDREYALATTQYVLQEFSKLLAPFMPFIAEEIYQKVKGNDAAESVHLENWPALPEADEKVLADMAAVREVISQALEQRASAGIKIRQPLGALTISQEFNTDYQQLILDEVNLKTILVGPEMTLNTTITPELQAEGDAREFIRSIQNLRKEKSFEPNDVVQLTISADAAGQELLTQFQSDIESVTNTKVSFDNTEGESVTVGDQTFVVQLIK